MNPGFNVLSISVSKSISCFISLLFQSLFPFLRPSHLHLYLTCSSTFQHLHYVGIQMALDRCGRMYFSLPKCSFSYIFFLLSFLSIFPSPTNSRSHVY